MAGGADVERLRFSVPLSLGFSWLPADDLFCSLSTADVAAVSTSIQRQHSISLLTSKLYRWFLIFFFFRSCIIHGGSEEVSFYAATSCGRRRRRGREPVPGR